MATPKKPIPLTQRKSRLDIEKAMQAAENMATPHVSPEEGAAKKSAPPPVAPARSQPAPARKIGRPALKAGRSERITVFLTPETRHRLRRALLQEQLSREANNDKVDQSLIVEEALEHWLKQHQY